MTYILQIDVQAAKALSNLPKDVAHRIFEKIRETKENPKHYWIRLEGRRDYKLRVGDYRIIADIDSENKLIQITKVGHRKTVYDEK